MKTCIHKKYRKKEIHKTRRNKVGGGKDDQLNLPVKKKPAILFSQPKKYTNAQYAYNALADIEKRREIAEAPQQIRPVTSDNASVSIGSYMPSFISNLFSVTPKVGHTNDNFTRVGGKRTNKSKRSKK